MASVGQEAFEVKLKRLETRRKRLVIYDLIFYSSSVSDGHLRGPVRVTSGGCCSGDNHRVVLCVPWRVDRRLFSLHLTWRAVWSELVVFIEHQVDGKRKANGADDEEMSRRPGPLNFSTSNRSILLSLRKLVRFNSFQSWRNQLTLSKASGDLK